MIPGLDNHLPASIASRPPSEILIKSKKEFWKLVKFGIVGASTFLFQLILYIILSRFLLPSITKLLVYLLAMGYAMAENYTAHRLWTFNDQILPKRSALRYALVVAFAATVNALIFWLGHQIIQIYDLLIVCFAGLMVPLITYAGHRWYTFRQ